MQKSSILLKAPTYVDLPSTMCFPIGMNIVCPQCRSKLKENNILSWNKFV